AAKVLETRVGLPASGDGLVAEEAAEPPASEIGTAPPHVQPPNVLAPRTAVSGAPPRAVEHEVVSRDVVYEVPNIRFSWTAATILGTGALFLFLWAIGGAWRTGRLIRGLSVVRRLRRSLRPATEPRLIEAAQKLCCGTRPAPG